MIDPMRKRTLWIASGALAGLWLVPAAFVALYDPGVPRTPRNIAAPDVMESALDQGEPQFFLLSHGYTKHWTVETWEGKDAPPADRTSVSYYVERGPLDRHAGTFRLTVGFIASHAGDLEGARLFVTSVGDWGGSDEAIWSQVAEATVKARGAGEAALTCRADVPASTTAYRLEEVRSGVRCCGFSQSMLTAPTFLGRVYDAIAWRSLFRWVPDLR